MPLVGGWHGSGVIFTMTALKGAIRRFSSLRRELSPTRKLKWPGCNHVQITCFTSGAHHVQYVVYHVVRRDSSAIMSDRVEIAFIVLLFYWLKR